MRIHAQYSGFLLGAILAALIILMTPAVSFAQAPARAAAVPVLVAGEDEDPSTIPRSHEIFQRVIAELKGVMSRAGFRVVEEAAVAVDLDWQIRDRRPRMDLIDMAKLMNQSADATHAVRALALISVRAEVRSLYSVTRIGIRMKSDIYDLASNRFEDSVEVEQSYLGPPGCLDEPGCIARVVGGHARELATTLGNGLVARLARFRDVPGGGIETPYTVTFRLFDRREALTMIAVMAEEFPGYRSHQLMRTDQGVRRYAYVTTATTARMEEWLAILLADMNFDPDRDVRIAIEGTDITVERIVPTSNRTRSGDDRAISE